MRNPQRSNNPTSGIMLFSILAFYLALTLLMTYPLITHFRHGILGPPADNFEYLYKLWWFKFALFDEGISPFFNPNVFYPEGYHLALHEMTLTNMLLGLPLTVLYGEVVSYNALMLFSFVLSAFGAYVLALYVTQSPLPALLSGVVYAFCSYRIAHLGYGHLNLMGTGWLPLIFLSLEKLLELKRSSWAILLGLFLGLMALSSWYYVPVTAISATVYVLWRQRPWRQKLLTKRVVFLFTVSLIVMGLLVAPSLFFTLQHRVRGEMGFALREVDALSASIEDFVIPNVMHPIWGKLVARHYAQRMDVMEQIIGLSWIAIALSLVALRIPRSQISIGIALLGAVSSTLALGTSFHIGGQRLYIKVPQLIERVFTVAVGFVAKRFALHPQPSYYDFRIPGAIYIPLPALLLYLYIPFLDAMRVWARFSLVTAFAVSMLAGTGLSRIMSSADRSRHNSRHRALFAWLCLGAAILELLAGPHPLGWSEVKAQPVDKWLAQQEGLAAVIELPLWRSERGPRLYATTVHRKPIAYGYGTFFPHAYRQVRPILWQDFPTTRAIQLLRQWGVQYILLRAESFGEEWNAVQKRMEQCHEMHLIGVFAEHAVYHAGWLAESLSDLAYAFVVDHVYVYELR